MTKQPVAGDRHNSKGFFNKENARANAAKSAQVRRQARAHAAAFAASLNYEPNKVNPDSIAVSLNHINQIIQHSRTSDGLVKLAQAYSTMHDIWCELTGRREPKKPKSQPAPEAPKSELPPQDPQ